MTRLGEIKLRYTRIADLRCLAGLTVEETAKVLEIPMASVKRERPSAKALLYRTIREGEA